MKLLAEMSGGKGIVKSFTIQIIKLCFVFSMHLPVLAFLQLNIGNAEQRPKIRADSPVILFIFVSED